MKIILDPGAFMPTRAHDTDAGLDLYCMEDKIIYNFEQVEYDETGGMVPTCVSAVFDTGVHMAIPSGCFGKIESKSGLNFKHDIVACGGVVDSGYTGSIKVKLYNLGVEPYRFRAGDKIAQIIIQPYIAPTLELVDRLDDTERGTDGFGSSGR